MSALTDQQEIFRLSHPLKHITHLLPWMHSLRAFSNDFPGKTPSANILLSFLHMLMSLKLVASEVRVQLIFWPVALWGCSWRSKPCSQLIQQQCNSESKEKENQQFCKQKARRAPSASKAPPQGILLHDLSAPTSARWQGEKVDRIGVLLFFTSSSSSPPLPPSLALLEASHNNYLQKAATKSSSFPKYDQNWQSSSLDNSRGIFSQHHSDSIFSSPASWKSLKTSFAFRFEKGFLKANATLRELHMGLLFYLIFMGGKSLHPSSKNKQAALRLVLVKLSWVLYQ